VALTDSAHSRVVGALRVLLPLAALALLSTLFLLARGRDPDAALPYAQVDIAQMLRDPRLTAPTYSGLTREGDEVIFSAATAHPGGTDRIGARAAEPVLRLIGADGSETRAEAREARIDPGAQLLVLTGEVALQSATGIQLRSDALHIRLDRSRMDSPGPVIAEGPQGRIEAGGFTLTRGAEPGQEVVVFNGGVKLLYTAQAGLSVPRESP
jgi:lipopolysaccharide export system protein LptC